MNSFGAYVYQLDQHLLANKIKEEEKYKTVLLLHIISKDENTHPRKTPATNRVRGDVCIHICHTKKYCQQVYLIASATLSALPFVLALYWWQCLVQGLWPAAQIRPKVWSLISERLSFLLWPFMAAVQCDCWLTGGMLKSWIKKLLHRLSIHYGMNSHKRSERTQNWPQS